MKEQIEVKGMIIAQSPMGEYDRRVVILTLEKGKISAFARGARRPNSQLVGASQPMTFGTFHLYAGKNSYTLLSAEIDNYFPELKKNLLHVTYGTYFLELAAYFTRENNDEREILKLLYQSLRALEKEKIPAKLIRCIYEIRILTAFGEGLQVFQCAHCGKTEELHWFASIKGGCLCESCKNYSVDRIKLAEGALYTLQFILSTPVERLFTFLVSEEVLSQLTKISNHSLRQYTNGEFKSLEMLEVLGES